jgi:hypothetical protein
LQNHIYYAVQALAELHELGFGISTPDPDPTILAMPEIEVLHEFEPSEL